MPTIKVLNTATLQKEEALAEYLKLVESYKIQNPVKYLNKKEAFDKKLAELGYKEKETK